MISVEEINNTIEQLESGNTTYDSCLKLASLYIVRDKLSSSDTIIDEYRDFLPAYNKYCQVKKNYQIGACNDVTVYESLSKVALELEEFMLTLYRNTENNQERTILKNTLNTITDKIK